jgi:hypothetical protein
MLNDVAHLPHLSVLEFIPADGRGPFQSRRPRHLKPYILRAIATTRKAIRQFLPDRGVHPEFVASAGLDYKLGPVEGAGKTCLRYNPCGSESEDHIALEYKEGRCLWSY